MNMEENNIVSERAAVFIVKDGAILLMHRIKNGREYYAVPGGKVEDGETPEQAARREAKEETNLDVVIGEKAMEFEREIYESDGEKNYHGIDDGAVKEYFFLVDSFSGEVALGGPEMERNSESNHYALKWVSFDDLPSVELLPPNTKNFLVERFCKAFV